LKWQNSFSNGVGKWLAILPPPHLSRHIWRETDERETHRQISHISPKPRFQFHHQRLSSIGSFTTATF
ncbi:hypothetical protein KK470_30350, partial [Klebsiella pneumoniae]|uniref:hypothetical protein n=1 Tax=Klebsiella pneumoniae TaxID=573 RepID=UPI001BE0DFCE